MHITRTIQGKIIALQLLLLGAPGVKAQDTIVLSLSLKNVVDLAINQNMFIEQVMQIHTYRKMTQREMETYRDPFRKPEWRRPLFMWAREVSIEGDVPHTDEAMERYNKWLLEKTIPSLEVYGFPGEVSEEYDVRWRVEHIKNHETAFIGPALHFVQESGP